MCVLNRLALLLALLTAIPALALGPDATQGQLLYPACHVCHDPALDPPLGPPMWGVKRIYQRNTLDDQDFVTSMVDFVKAPSQDNAKHSEAVAQLGLMPPLPLPDALLQQIATYILEEHFPPPCDHWAIAAQRALARGDHEHAAKDQRQLERFCQ